jgi:hypothetical protein
MGLPWHRRHPGSGCSGRTGDRARTVERLIPWAIGGFILNLITGFLFFTGDPFQYIHNTVFWLKLLFMVLAGVNALAFYVTGIARRVDALRPNEAAPASAKFIAATSLVLWIGVIYWGRMLPFLGGASKEGLRTWAQQK